MVCMDVANKLSSDPTVNVAFRRSMEKFESANRSIDIVRASNFSLSYLNRQIILLLSSQGIADSVFHALQDEMIDEVMSITRNAQRACHVLRQFNGKSGGNETHRMLIGYLSRFGLRQEDFARRLLLCFQAFQLKQLRTKARILIKNGCVLFGVVDETKTLKYEEVFIQMTENETGKARIIKDTTVIVTRNPCLHPGKTFTGRSALFSPLLSHQGDIRRYRAVDNPLLHELKNVIVFPMDGPKSMTAELAGGDLDGDTFWITWDQRLVFAKNYPALCYSQQSTDQRDSAANGSDRSYSIADICRFFVQYIEADNLGVIATWHLALADKYGVTDKRCLKLAEMHRFEPDRELSDGEHSSLL